MIHSLRSIVLPFIVMAMPVPAVAGDITLASAGGLAFGDGASVTTQTDGTRLASNGKDQKVCGPDRVAIAATVPVTIVTTDGSRTYDDGLVACYDLARFNGGIVITTEARITLRPQP